MPATRLAALFMGLLDRLFKKERPPAIAELVKAAEQGDREAQCKLGFAYADGEGVTQDFEQACRWFALAAEQSHPEAQFSIGPQICRRSNAALKNRGRKRSPPPALFASWRP